MMILKSAGPVANATSATWLIRYCRYLVATSCCLYFWVNVDGSQSVSILGCETFTILNLWCLYGVVQGCRSDLKSIKYGVALGPKIGPLLFLIYVNDLPNLVRLLIRCIPRLFADDTCLLFADAYLNPLFENINSELR